MFSVSTSPAELLRTDPSYFQVPLQYASMSEIYKGNGDKLIIHIQDAHTNFSGQENLAGALDEIMSTYKVSLVLSEGGAGDCTLDEAKKIAPPEVLKRVAKSYFVRGELAGEEYLNLTSGHPMKIMGIEDMGLYAKSVQNYAALAEKREAILEYLGIIRRSLGKVKTKLYPKELLSYEGSKKASGVSPAFQSNFGELSRLIDRAALDLSDFPAIRDLRLLEAKEKKIDFDAANLEQLALIEEIGKRGGREDLKSFVEKMLRMKNQKASLFSYFQNTLNIAQKTRISTGKYPHLLLYVDYLKDFTALDLEEVLKEMEKVEDLVYVKLLKDSADARLVRAIDRYLGLLSSAYNIQMTTREFELFQANEPDFATISYLAFLNRKLAEAGYFEDLIAYENSLEEGKKALEAFYDSVTRRDDAFIQNTALILDEENQKIAFLITGGYHTPNLKKLFKEKGYSYVVLTPIVANETNQNKYEKLLLAPLHKELKKLEKEFRGYKKKNDGVRNVLMAVSKGLPPDARAMNTWVIFNYSEQRYERFLVSIALAITNNNYERALKLVQDAREAVAKREAELEELDRPLPTGQKSTGTEGARAAVFPVISRPERPRDLITRVDAISRGVYPERSRGARNDKGIGARAAEARIAGIASWIRVAVRLVLIAAAGIMLSGNQAYATSYLAEVVHSIRAGESALRRAETDNPPFFAERSAGQSVIPQLREPEDWVEVIHRQFQKVRNLRGNPTEKVLPHTWDIPEWVEITGSLDFLYDKTRILREGAGTYDLAILGLLLLGNGSEDDVREVENMLDVLQSGFYGGKGLERPMMLSLYPTGDNENAFEGSDAQVNYTASIARVSGVYSGQTTDGKAWTYFEDRTGPNAWQVILSADYTRRHRSDRYVPNLERIGRKIQRLQIREGRFKGAVRYGSGNQFDPSGNPYRAFRTVNAENNISADVAANAALKALSILLEDAVSRSDESAAARYRELIQLYESIKQGIEEFFANAKRNGFLYDGPDGMYVRTQAFDTTGNGDWVFEGRFATDANTWFISAFNKKIDEWNQPGSIARIWGTVRTRTGIARGYRPVSSLDRRDGMRRVPLLGFDFTDWPSPDILLSPEWTAGGENAAEFVVDYSGAILGDLPQRYGVTRRDTLFWSRDIRSMYRHITRTNPGAYAFWRGQLPPRDARTGHGWEGPAEPESPNKPRFLSTITAIAAAYHALAMDPIAAATLDEIPDIAGGASESYDIGQKHHFSGELTTNLEGIHSLVIKFSKEYVGKRVSVYLDVAEPASGEHKLRRNQKWGKSKRIPPSGQLVAPMSWFRLRPGEHKKARRIVIGSEDGFVPFDTVDAFDTGAVSNSSPTPTTTPTSTFTQTPLPTHTPTSVASSTFTPTPTSTPTLTFTSAQTSSPTPAKTSTVPPTPTFTSHVTPVLLANRNRLRGWVGPNGDASVYADGPFDVSKLEAIRLLTPRQFAGEQIALRLLENVGDASWDFSGLNPQRDKRIITVPQPQGNEPYITVDVPLADWAGFSYLNQVGQITVFSGAFVEYEITFKDGNGPVEVYQIWGIPLESLQNPSVIQALVRWFAPLFPQSVSENVKRSGKTERREKIRSRRAQRELLAKQAASSKSAGGTLAVTLAGARAATGVDRRTLLRTSALAVAGLLVPKVFKAQQTPSTREGQIEINMRPYAGPQSNLGHFIRYTTKPYNDLDTGNDRPEDSGLAKITEDSKFSNGTMEFEIAPQDMTKLQVFEIFMKPHYKRGHAADKGYISLTFRRKKGGGYYLQRYYTKAESAKGGAESDQKYTEDSQPQNDLRVTAKVEGGSIHVSIRLIKTIKEILGGPILQVDIQHGKVTGNSEDVKLTAKIRVRVPSGARAAADQMPTFISSFVTRLFKSGIAILTASLSWLTLLSIFESRSFTSVIFSWRDVTPSATPRKSDLSPSTSAATSLLVKFFRSLLSFFGLDTTFIPRSVEATVANVANFVNPHPALSMTVGARAADLVGELAGARVGGLKEPLDTRMLADSQIPVQAGSRLAGQRSGRKKGQSARVLYQEFKQALAIQPDGFIETLRGMEDLGQIRRILMSKRVTHSNTIAGKFLKTAVEERLLQLTPPLTELATANWLKYGGHGRHLQTFIDGIDFIVKTYREQTLKKTVLVRWVGEGLWIAQQRLRDLAAPTMVIGATEGEMPFVYLAADGTQRTTDLAIVQEKVTPLLDKLKILERAGDIKGAESLIDDYKKLTIEMFKRGVVDTDFGGILANYGVNKKGRLVAFDVGDFSGGVNWAYQFTDYLDDETNAYVENGLRAYVGDIIANYFKDNPFRSSDFVGPDGGYLFGVDYEAGSPGTFRMLFPYSEAEVREMFANQVAALGARAAEAAVIESFRQKVRSALESLGNAVSHFRLEARNFDEEVSRGWLSTLDELGGLVGDKIKAIEDLRGRPLLNPDAKNPALGSQEQALTALLHEIERAITTGANPMVVLLVDDSEDARELAARIIRKYFKAQGRSVEIIEAGNLAGAKQALDIIRTRQDVAKLVVTDLEFPEKEGEAIDRSGKQGKQMIEWALEDGVPVVLQTGREVESLNLPERSGYAYVEKVVDSDRFSENLEKALKGVLATRGAPGARVALQKAGAAGGDRFVATYDARLADSHLAPSEVGQISLFFKTLLAQAVVRGAPAGGKFMDVTIKGPEGEIERIGWIEKGIMVREKGIIVQASVVFRFFDSPPVPVGIPQNILLEVQTVPKTPAVDHEAVLKQLEESQALRGWVTPTIRTISLARARGVQAGAVQKPRIYVVALPSDLLESTEAQRLSGIVKEAFAAVHPLIGPDDGLVFVSEARIFSDASGRIIVKATGGDEPVPPGYEVVVLANPTDQVREQILGKAGLVPMPRPKISDANVKMGNYMITFILRHQLGVVPDDGIEKSIDQLVDDSRINQILRLVVDPLTYKGLSREDKKDLLRMMLRLDEDLQRKGQSFFDKVTFVLLDAIHWDQVIAGARLVQRALGSAA